MQKIRDFNDDDALRCPSCGGTNLHHEKIEVFDREDDSTTGLHTTIENRQVKIDSDMTDNPSARRDGMSIHFWCENCDAKSTLSILQHKGNTFFEFSTKNDLGTKTSREIW